MQQDAVVPGETVWLRQQRWRVARTRHGGNVVRLDLTNRTGARTFWWPFDRFDRLVPRARLKRRRPQAALARIAALAARAGQARTLPVVVDARLEILPHQLEPALAIFSGTRRVLLADEVGLGKTLQAAIVIAEMVRRRAESRVLVVVPAPLVAQWAAELRSRFDLPCRIADRDGLDDAGRDAAVGETAWRRAGIWLATLDFLKQPHVLRSLPADPWDLAIVDEAHGACGLTDRHAAADQILRRARRYLLLTATPHSGDDERYTRLLDLGALPGRQDRMTIFRRSRAVLGASPPRRVRWPRVTLSAREIAALDALAEFEREIARAAGSLHLPTAMLLLAVFRKRALSTMTALAVSLERRIAWLDSGPSAPSDVWMQPAFAFDADDDGEDEGRALAGLTGMDAALERRWLKRLLALARAAATVESKLTWIARLLARTAEPVILFTEFRHSLDAARSRLERRRIVAVVHGGQRDAERAAELASFLDGRASVLIATDVAGQGLNLQHRARWVVNLELPWNPVRLEQRAGRVDRIGQARPVHVTSTVAKHAAEADLLMRLARRALIAQRALDDGTLSIAPMAVVAERDVVAGVILGRTIAAVPAPRLPLCTRWHRHARVIARGIARRRRFCLSWKGPAPGITPTTRVDVSRLPAFARRSRCWLVFMVPLLDDAGDVVESRVVSVLAPFAPCDATLGAAAGVEASRACEARARRLARAQAATAKHDVAIEQALEAAASADDDPSSAVQPGLFDRRAERRAFESLARRDAAEVALTGRLRSVERTSRVHAGPASLIAVLAAPR